MKIEITRRELIKLASFAKLSDLAWDKRAFYLETALAEKGLDTATPADGNEILRKSIEVAMREYRSDYLVDLVYTYTQQEYQVVGKERSLKACPCCCYKTLKKRREYFICEVCFWQDDGVVSENDHSSVNSISLEEASSNFFKFGAISENMAKDLDKDRMKRYFLDENCLVLKKR